MDKKEYVKIELGTFYRFVETLEILLSCSDISKKNTEYLKERIKEFECEVVEETINKE